DASLDSIEVALTVGYHHESSKGVSCGVPEPAEVMEDPDDPVRQIVELHDPGSRSDEGKAEGSYVVAECLAECVDDRTIDQRRAVVVVAAPPRHEYHPGDVAE